MGYSWGSFRERVRQDRAFWIVVALILVAFIILQGRSALAIGLTLAALLIAITVHECSHAWAAWRLGDSTAATRGRLSLNPVVHLDPLGTIMMLITTLTGLGIGWGKPVPVVPYRLRFGPRLGNGIVALAGPLANLVVAVLVGLPLRYIGVIGWPWLGMVLQTIAIVNLMIAFFNLLPIPPLDGYSVLIGLLALLPSRLVHEVVTTLERWNRFGMVLLFGVILFSQLLGLNLLGRVVGQPAFMVYRWIIGA